MMHIEEAAKVAKLLGVTVEYLYGLNELTLEESQLIAKYRECDDRGKATVLRTASAEVCASEPSTSADTR